MLTVEVHILWIPSHRHSLASSNPIISTIHRAKRVRHDFMVGQHPWRARLERDIVAASTRIKSLDTRQYRIHVLPTPPNIRVDIRNDELPIPVLLQEATHLGRLRVAVRTARSDGARERAAFDERAVLRRGREETRALDFLPQVEAGLVPVLRDVLQVVADNGPDDVGSCGAIAVREKPAAVCDECCSA